MTCALQQRSVQASLEHESHTGLQSVSQCPFMQQVHVCSMVPARSTNSAVYGNKGECRLWIFETHSTHNPNFFAEASSDRQA